jgi:integrase
MSRRRMLPKYVSQFTDTRGRERFRFRRAGAATYYFKAALGSEEFRTEYQDCLDRAPATKAGRRGATPGSVDDALVRYYASGDFNTGKSITRQKRRALLEWFREFRGDAGQRMGDAPARAIQFEHLDKIITTKAAEHHFAALNLRKQIKRFCKWMVKARIRLDNPADHTTPLSAKTSGFHTWTEIEIAQYQAHHPLGTKARLALELFLWTGKRRGDGVDLGPQHVQDGCFYGIDEKTQKPAWIPIAPQLQEAIDAMGPSQHLAYLVSERGRAFSAKSFGNRMRKWCDEAGLPNCTTHGLRKAISRRLAEAEQGNAQIKSITQHGTDTEVAIYTRQAEQRRLAKSAMRVLSLAHQNGSPQKKAANSDG